MTIECRNFNIKISDVCKHVPMKEGGMISVQEEKEKLIRNVKKSVKHLMEESVTKKVDRSADIDKLLRSSISSPNFS